MSSAEIVKLKAISMDLEAREKKEIEREDVEDKTVIEPEELAGTILPWTEQITVRGVVASIVIGMVYSVIAMKLNLTTGIVPNLNVSAALLAFVFIRTWTNLLQKAGFESRPFTRQENTMIQTCAVACYSIAVGGIWLSHIKLSFVISSLFFFFKLF